LSVSSVVGGLAAVFAPFFCGLLAFSLFNSKRPRTRNDDAKQAAVELQQCDSPGFGVATECLSVVGY
jgi:hypothetical protein